MFDFTLLIVSVVTFLVLILILVGLLLVAKSKLLPKGSVKIDINNSDKVLTVEPGASLISTLSAEKIYLPSACGGMGTCGLCKCQVLSGAGSILPTEVGFFNRKQQSAHWRLGCQVKVREDMEILLPETILGVRKYECEVLSNRNVATFIKELIVRLPEGENLKFHSGGYVQIDIPAYSDIDYQDLEVDEPYREDWESLNMRHFHARNEEPTTRAYSMANDPSEGNIVMLNVRIATPPFDKSKGEFMKVLPGISSSYVFSLKVGDKLTLSGPYGEFFLRDTDREMVFIGGGAGMAPMRSHIFHLFKTLKTTRKVSFWYGARSRKEIFYEDSFEELERMFPNFSFHIALSEPLPSDEWKGSVGFIHQVLYDEYLSGHKAPEDVEYYLCGPPMMTSSVITMLDNLGVMSDNILFDDFGQSK